MDNPSQCLQCVPFLHKVQTFRHSLLWCGCGSPVPSRKCCPVWSTELSPWVCSSMGLPQGHSLLAGIHLLQCVSPSWAAGGSLILCGLQRHTCLTRGCRGASAPVPGAPLVLPSALTWVSAGLCLTLMSIIKARDEFYFYTLTYKTFTSDLLIFVSQDDESVGCLKVKWMPFTSCNSVIQ